MIKIKHFLDCVETDDGPRAWVEPVGLTKDLQELCSVDEVLSMLGPPGGLWEWFAAHPEGYEDFRGRYHEWLSTSPYRPMLQQLARESLRENVTLLHAGDDANRNCATALRGFITALRPHCLERR